MPNEIICGDCLKELKKFPNNAFDYCLTSPPFREEDWGGAQYWNNFDRLINLLKNKVSKTAFVFNSSTKIRQMLERYPEITRILIWGKSPSCYSYRYEPIFVFEFDKLFKVNRFLFKDFWQMPAIEKNSETFENPVKLYREILLKLPKGKVLDCFAGTGTTGLACKQLKHEYCLIEKEPTRIEMIKERLKQTVW